MIFFPPLDFFPYQSVILLPRRWPRLIIFTRRCPLYLFIILPIWGPCLILICRSILIRTSWARSRIALIPLGIIVSILILPWSLRICGWVLSRPIRACVLILIASLSAIVGRSAIYA